MALSSLTSQGVRFVRGTHLLFTASKDKTLKLWDADRFEKVRGTGLNHHSGMMLLDRNSSRDTTA